MLLVGVTALAVIGAACSNGSSADAPASTEVETTTTTAASEAPTTTAAVVTVDRTTFVAEGNEICTRMDDARAALEQEPASQGGTPAARAHLLDGLAAITAAALQEIQAEPPPAGDEAAVAEVYARVQAEVDLTRRAAAATGDDAGASASLVAQMDQAAASADEAANAYGLTECGTG